MLSRNSVPRDDGLNGGKRIAARLLGFQQGTTDARRQAHFGVDRLARLPGSARMVTLRLTEQRAHEAVVKVDDLVDQRGARCRGARPREWRSGGSARGRAGAGGHLAALAGELEQAVLVDGAVQDLRQPEVSDRLQPLDGAAYALVGRSGGWRSQIRPLPFVPSRIPSRSSRAR